MPRPISNRGITTPYRPEDHGFTEVYRHGGGGVGQTPDVWDNSYFDGSYFHNGKIVGENDEEIAFVTELTEGSHQLAPFFRVKQGELGAYYASVTRMD